MQRWLFIMDYSAPVSRRTRSRQAEIYRDLFEKRKKEKEKERESSSNVGFSIDSGVVFLGKEEAVEFDSTKDSMEGGNNSRSGRGTIDNPFCIEDENDEDDDEEENDSDTSGVDTSSDDDYMESLSDESDDDDDDDSSDFSYDIDQEKRHYRKRNRASDFDIVHGLWRRRGSDEEEDLFFEEEGECHEVSGIISEKKRKEKKGESECEKVKRTIGEASASGTKKRTNGEDSVSEKEKRTSGGASVSGSEFDEIEFSEESFTGVKEGTVNEVVQKVGSVAKRTRVGSSSGRGKEKIGDGTVSQPFLIDHDDDVDVDVDDDEVEESEEVVKANNKKQELRKRGRPPKRKHNRGEKALDVSQILVDSISERRQIEDLVSHGTETPREDGQMPQVKLVLPLDFNFGVEEPKPMEKSASELELDKLWDEMNLCLAAGEIGSSPNDMVG